METFSDLENKEAGIEETDSEAIQKLFREMPSDKIELLANHLARPDGFAKTLITGCIAGSEELRKKIGQGFAKTTRGHYMHYPATDSFGHNDDLSFNVGKPQRFYQETSTKRLNRDWKNGLGFSVPAKTLLARKNVEPSWGAFQLYKAVQLLKQSPLSESEFEKYYNISQTEAFEIDQYPPKEGFLTLVHMARKAGLLSGEPGDQAEINMRKENEKFPRLSLEKTIILIPQKSKSVFEKYLSRKLKESMFSQDEIKSAFGVDVSGLNAEEIINRYPNIYWYPQENIGLAIEYLSTHPQNIYARIKT